MIKYLGANRAHLPKGISELYETKSSVVKTVFFLFDVIL